MYRDIPMGPTLSGFEVEYRVIQLHSRDCGRNSASFYFFTGTEPDLDVFPEGILQ